MMMVVVIVGLLIPWGGSLFIKDPGRDQTVSSVICIILLLVYAMYLATHVFHLRTERRSPKRHGKTMPLPSPAKEQEEQSEEVEAVTGGANPHEVDNRKPPKLWLAVVLLTAATVSSALRM